MMVASGCGGIDDKQDWFHGCVTHAVAQGPSCRRILDLVWCSAVLVLKFLIICEQGAPYFYFPVDPTNYIAGSDYKYLLIFFVFASFKQ